MTCGDRLAVGPADARREEGVEQALHGIHPELGQAEAGHLGGRPERCTHGEGCVCVYSCASSSSLRMCMPCNSAPAAHALTHTPTMPRRAMYGPALSLSRRGFFASWPWVLNHLDLCGMGRAPANVVRMTPNVNDGGVLATEWPYGLRV